MTDILMPALSPTMEDGVLAKWNIKEGDRVRAGDVIAEIETDKATMEVEAVDEGVVEAILVKAGTEGVKVNTPIARLREGEGGQPDADADAEVKAPAKTPTQKSPDAPPAARDPLADAPVGRGAALHEKADAVVEGAPTPAVERNAPANAIAAARTPPHAPAGVFAPRTIPGESADPAAAAEAERLKASPTAEPLASPRRETPAQRIFASPLARRIAGERGLDLAALTGSGPHGRIVKADVEAAKTRPQASSAPPQRGLAEGSGEAAASSPTLEQMGIAPGSYELLPLDSMRKTIARRMTESFRDIPHFPLTVDLEIDRLLDARARINAARGATGAKVSVNDILIKACALALKAVPEANASYTPEGLARHHHADIAVAVAIEGGLITPIVRRAEQRSLGDIASAMRDLAERARARKLKPEEFQGGTFSLSNLGMMGIKSFSSILNAPQGCILSVGAGEKRAVVRGDQLAMATVMTVTLTCDHRVVDGAIGARWLGAFRRFVEDPIVMLA